MVQHLVCILILKDVTNLYSLFFFKFVPFFIAAQTIIMQHLQYFEHTSDYMAELIAVLLKEFDYPQLGEEILRSVL